VSWLSIALLACALLVLIGAEFAASVERDLEKLPTIEERDRS
jgi:hypothetical protein